MSRERAEGRNWWEATEVGEATRELGGECEVAREIDEGLACWDAMDVADDGTWDRVGEVAGMADLVRK